MEGHIFNIQKFSLHDGTGIRTNVFFQGCNLRCKWCSNPESQETDPKRQDSDVRRYTVDALMAELVKDKPFYDMSGGGVTLTGGEVLLQPEFALKLCGALRTADIGIALETSANVDTEIFQKVLRECDIVHIDMKHCDDEAHRRGTGVGNELILSNIRNALESGVRTVIRIPVIPGFNDSSGDMWGFVSLLKRLGAREAQLLPFHQMGESKYQKLGMEYEYADVPQLHDEDMEPFAGILAETGARIQIGG